MLFLYNTLSRRKEHFVPLNPDHVKLYVCGPTVYDAIHVGNARAYGVFDLLYRTLKHFYPQVTYVRNITDIDDKIIQRAQKDQEDLGSLTLRTTSQFQENLKTLGLLSPTIEPQATEHVPQMIRLIQKLMDQNHAYEAHGHVLFDVTSFPSYGQLSGFSVDEQKAGARIEVAPYKRHPADFVLWKPSPKEPFFPGWESPWGYGRPGWHIECSAMSVQYLGIPFDIHGGGQDLLFPHHENERAQSCCAAQSETFANFWIHNGIVTVNGEKMSKSLGNVVSLEDALVAWPAEVIRWVFLATHYRQPFNWTTDTLAQGKAALNRLYGALRVLKDTEPPVPLDPEFEEALKDDLHTPKAFARLHYFAHQVYCASNQEIKQTWASKLKACGSILGFFQTHPENWFQQTSEKHLQPEKIAQAIRERDHARSKKDFETSDRIRQELLSQGITLEDTVEGTKWRLS